MTPTTAVQLLHKELSYYDESENVSVGSVMRLLNEAEAKFPAPTLEQVWPIVADLFHDMQQLATTSDPLYRAHNKLTALFAAARREARPSDTLDGELGPMVDEPAPPSAECEWHWPCSAGFWTRLGQHYFCKWSGDAWVIRDCRNEHDGSWQRRTMGMAGHWQQFCDEPWVRRVDQSAECERLRADNERLENLNDRQVDMIRRDIKRIQDLVDKNSALTARIAALEDELRGAKVKAEAWEVLYGNEGKEAQLIMDTILAKRIASLAPAAKEAAE